MLPLSLFPITMPYQQTYTHVLKCLSLCYFLVTLQDQVLEQTLFSTAANKLRYCESQKISRLIE